MSRRTAQASRAIADAWENERQLVSEGKGTRDWSREEQEDILATGKAHDANGRAFEGHHMQSVSYKPEYQGEAGNIQFLSREEHLAAHEGSFQNKTNGFYDYKTGKTEPFKGDRFVSCTIINLTHPVSISHIETPDSINNMPEPEEVKNDPITSKPKPTSANQQQNLNRKTAAEIQRIRDAELLATLQKLSSIQQAAHRIEIKRRNRTVFGYLGNGLKALGKGTFRVVKAVGRGVGNALEFLSEHPEITEPILNLIETAADVMTINNMNSHDNNNDKSGADDLNPRSDNLDSIPDIDTLSDDTERIKRASPREHTVNDPGQHYWKGGERVWIPKKPYRRGGNNNDGTDEDED